MDRALHQMPALAGWVAVRRGEASSGASGDEARSPRHDPQGAGRDLLSQALARDNMQRAWKRVKANKGAAGVDGLDIGQTITAMPADQWQSIPVPALIDADLFAAVQAQLQENRDKARTRRRGARYLLQGLLVCKQCGYAYYGKPLSRSSAKGHVRHYAYYRCIGSDAYRFGGQRVCTTPQVRTDCLEQAVWQEVRGLLMDPHRLTREYERRLQALAHPADDAQRRSLDSQLRQCRQGVVRVIDAYSEGYLEKEEFESRITRLRERQTALERQIEQLENEALSRNELQLVVGRLEDFAARVTGSVDDMEVMAQRELIRTLVKRIDIDREQVNVVFRVTPASPNDPGALESLPDCWGRA